MARGQRKTIKEKIEAKKEETRLLKIRIEKEEAAGILEEHLQGNYEETA